VARVTATANARREKLLRKLECTFRKIDMLVNTATECDYEHPLVKREEERVSQLRKGWTTNGAVYRSAIVAQWFLNELWALPMLKKQGLGVFLQ